jgi:hypothetical protein
VRIHPDISLTTTLLQLVCRLYVHTNCYRSANKLLQVCKQVVTGLQTSCYRSANKLLQVCKQVVTNLFTSCWQLVLVLLVLSCCNKFGTNCQQLVTSLMALSDFLKVVLTSLIQSWYKINVTRLTTQGCNNIVISWLYQTCWNNLATSLIISTRFLQVVNSLFQTCWQLETSSANTTCWRPVGRLATRVPVKMWDFYVLNHEIFVLNLHEWIGTNMRRSLGRILIFFFRWLWRRAINKSNRQFAC